MRRAGAPRPLLSCSSRRAFGLALACAAGVVLAQAGSAKTMALAIGALLVPAAACSILGARPAASPAARGRRRLALLRPVLVSLVFCAAAGGVAALDRAGDPAPPLLAAWRERGFAEQRTPVVVRGIVADLERPDPDRAVILLRTIAPSGADPAPLRFRLPAGLGVRLTVPISPEEEIPWNIGDRLETTARLGPPRSWRNPGGFDYAAALRTHGVSLSGSIKSPRLVEPLGREPAWRRAGPRLRRRLVTALENAAPDRRATADFLLALLLGERQSLDPDLEDRLKRAGVYHILALSGFNVALVAGAAGWALRLVLRKPGARRVATILILLFYGLVARPGGSILRATLMGAALLVARQAGRSGSAAGSLATSGTILLLLCPAWLADPGFQLSYAATLGLLFGLRPAGMPANRGRLAPRTRAARAILWLGGQAMGSIRVSAAALAATAPLTARHFQSVTLAGLLANLAAVPLASLGLFLGMAAAPLAMAWPAGARALLTVAAPLVSLLDASASFAADLPGASFFIQPPSWGAAALLLLLAAAAALSPRGAARRALFGLAAVVALLLAARGRDPRPPGRLDFVVFDVGQGDALLVRTPLGKTMLVDAGGLPRGDFDVGARVIAPALRALGVLRLDLLVVTHPHQDHLGGAPAIVRTFRPESVWIGASGFDDPRLRALEAAAEATGTRLLLPRRGVTVRFGGLHLDVLNPVSRPEGRARSGRSGNDESIVLRVRFGCRSLLLTGDMEGPAESSLLAEGRPVAAEILKVAHHGSDTSTGAMFLEAVAPGTAVVSAGLFNPWGHPSPRVIRRLEAAGVRVFRTDRDGAVRARTDGLSPWRLKRLTSGDEEDSEDLGGHREERQHEQQQPEEGDGGASGAERLDRIEGTRMAQADEPEENAEDDEMRPAGEEPQEDEQRAPEAGDDRVHARRDRVQHVAAVELANRQQVQRGGEQPEPGCDEQRVQVDRGPLRRIEEQWKQEREEQTGREPDLSRRRRRVRRGGKGEPEREDWEQGDKARNRAGHADVEQRPSRGKGGPDADDRSEGPEEVHTGQEIREGGVDPVETAGDVVPHLVATQDEQRGEGIGKPGAPLARVSEEPRQQGV
jgi:competence protein ComEC